MADSFFNKERVHELKEAFKLKSGGEENLKTSDLGPLLEAIGLPPLSVKETIAMEGDADPDRTGNVSFDSFLEVLKAKFAPPFNEEKLDKAFGVLRNPANKKIHIDEMKHFLLAYNDECNQDAVNDFAKNVPLDGQDVDIDKFVKNLLG
mmetsp:Transcript_66329/g.59528  ORF Transcript_66329/g.59528 Transcript_66329/m.59528 type:complete len:149 (+) Transcript_66329:98-544(+)|eukprot:CAMPEP_0201565082 /NCGR_PEP_ID=MMETSP0190_2-20130828/3905_1 /ASSEMBLY_ACC=CAM_ASM_000263 /TAXON_ID=37353 /ORGANISM="Rosalina sp." /LENGTH=148 /DNA_ID=CAMNT_0047982105 /DNA_START=98 /DNA_END=544 /DNA_ORIENTATION=+